MARAASINGKRGGQGLDWRLWLHFTEGALAAAVLVALVAFAVHWGRGAGNLPIRAVKVEGAFRHLDEQELKRVVAAHVGGGFFAVDIDAIRRAVAERPWVARVWVRRVWPDTLRIHVREHVALARWGDHGLLDQEGVWFGAPQEGLAAALPHLSGPEGLQRTLASRYRALRAHLEPLGLAPAHIHVSERRAWRVVLDNGMEVRLGRGDVDALMGRFVSLYPRVLAPQAERVEAVDMRYTNGFAVRWRPEAGPPHEEPAVSAG